MDIRNEELLPVIAKVGRGPKGDSFKVEKAVSASGEVTLVGKKYDERTKTWSTEWTSPDLTGGKLTFSTSTYPGSPGRYSITFNYVHSDPTKCWSVTTPELLYYSTIPSAPGKNLWIKKSTESWDATSDSPHSVEERKTKQEKLLYPAGQTRTGNQNPAPTDDWSMAFDYGFGGDIDVFTADNDAAIIGDTKANINAVAGGTGMFSVLVGEDTYTGSNLIDLIANVANGLYDDYDPRCTSLEQTASTLVSWKNTFGNTRFGYSTSYYINPSIGNDSTGTGTSSAPWKTLKKAVDSLRYKEAKILIVVKHVSGTYSDDTLGAYNMYSGLDLSITVENSSTSDMTFNIGLSSSKTVFDNCAFRLMAGSRNNVRINYDTHGSYGAVEFNNSIVEVFSSATAAAVRFYAPVTMNSCQYRFDGELTRIQLGATWGYGVQFLGTNGTTYDPGIVMNDCDGYIRGVTTKVTTKTASGWTTDDKLRNYVCQFNGGHHRIDSMRITCNSTKTQSYYGMRWDDADVEIVGTGIVMTINEATTLVDTSSSTQDTSAPTNCCHICCLGVFNSRVTGEASVLKTSFNNGGDVCLTNWARFYRSTVNGRKLAGVLAGSTHAKLRDGSWDYAGYGQRLILEITSTAEDTFRVSSFFSGTCFSGEAQHEIKRTMDFHPHLDALHLRYMWYSNAHSNEVLWLIGKSETDDAVVYEVTNGFLDYGGTTTAGAQLNGANGCLLCAYPY